MSRILTRTRGLDGGWMHPKQMTTKDKILKLRELRIAHSEACFALGNFIKSLKDSGSKYSLGQVDEDSLALMNELKIEFATEEIEK